VKPKPHGVNLVLLVLWRSAVILSGFLLYLIWYFYSKLSNGKSTFAQFESTATPTEYFSNFHQTKIGSVDLQNSTTLSGSVTSHSAIVIVSVITAIVVLTMLKAIKLDRKSAFVITVILFIGNLFLLLQIDDLPDEGYVWASKVDNFVKNGHLGVSLHDGTFGESTVGFLQFLAAAAPRILGLSVEQSLYVPLWIIFTIAQFLVFKLVLERTNSRVYASTSTGVIFLLPAIGYNFAFAFDNIMALSFLLIWLYVELSSKFTRVTEARIVLVTLLPLVRLDFAIVSFGIVLLHFFELRLFEKKKLISEINRHKTQYSVAFLATFVWLTYKVWAFNDIVPAMAKYKSFHPGDYLLATGAKYVSESLSVDLIVKNVYLQVGTLLLLLFMLAIYLKKRMHSPSLENKYPVSDFKLTVLIKMNFIFLVVTSYVALLAGGDYFGPLFIRYQFPFLVSLLLLYLIWIKRDTYHGKEIDSKDKVVWKKYFHYAAIVLVTSNTFLSPSEIKYVADDLVKVSPGRTTCEQAAALALKKAFPNIEVVATPEVNGLAYHAGLTVIDLIGLVSSRVEKEDFVGDSLHKFRITQTNEEVAATQVLWLYQGAECSLNESELTPSEKYQERMSGLVNIFPGNFRVIDFNRYIQSGLKPHILVFDYRIQGKHYFGKAFTFVKE
jgi:hypothetical protein